MQNATLRPTGGVWHIAFNDRNAHVQDMKGLWHLRELVSRPNSPVLALSLIAATLGLVALIDRADVDIGILCGEKVRELR